MKVWIWRGNLTGIPVAVIDSPTKPEDAPARFSEREGQWEEYVSKAYYNELLTPVGILVLAMAKAIGKNFWQQAKDVPEQAWIDLVNVYKRVTGR